MLVRSSTQNRSENFRYPRDYSQGSRGVYALGGNGSGTSANGYGPANLIYYSIPLQTTATTFGTGTGKQHVTGTSGRGRGLTMGGYNGNYNSFTHHTAIEYVTISTPGNLTTFGNLTASRSDSGAVSNGSRALNISGRVAAGNDQGARTSNIDYVTIATTGNASDFGDLRSSRYSAHRTAAGDGIIGITISTTGWNGDTDYDYFNISTPGNSTKWGDPRSGGLTGNYEHGMAVSNGSRGVWTGGYAGSYFNSLDYLTFATQSNALQLGNWHHVLLSESMADDMAYGAGCSFGDRGVVSSGGEDLYWFNIDGTPGTSNDGKNWQGYNSGHYLPGANGSARYYPAAFAGD